MCETIVAPNNILENGVNQINFDLYQAVGVRPKPENQMVFGICRGVKKRKITLQLGVKYDETIAADDTNTEQ